MSGFYIPFLYVSESVHGEASLKMPRFFLSSGNADLGFFTIEGEDAHHISYSLRMREGESLTVCDGEGMDYRCRISRMDGRTVTVEIEESTPSQTESPVQIHLYQSVAKGDKMDYIVQKAVELGVSEILPVYSERCIVRPDSSGDVKRIARLGRIAQEAAKQCGRGKIPRIGLPVRFSEAVDQIKGQNAFICYEKADALFLRQYLESFSDECPQQLCFFIGPEGGFSEEEVKAASDAGAVPVTLGARILRCEPASGYVLSCLSYAFERQL